MFSSATPTGSARMASASLKMARASANPVSIAPNSSSGRKGVQYAPRRRTSAALAETASVRGSWQREKLQTSALFITRNLPMTPT